MLFSTLVSGLGLSLSCSVGITQGMSSAEDSVVSHIDVVFVANEGVLIATQTKKVMVDALYDVPNPAYLAPPREMLEAMEAGGAPFDDVNVVLLTHDHPDHYNPHLVARFLSQSRRTVFVAPLDAVQALEEVVEDWPELRERVVSVELEVGAVLDTVVSGIGIEAFRTLHSGAADTPHNLMYLIEMDGRTIFHEGDSDGSVQTFTALGLDDREIDLALVHFWFPLNQDGEAILRGVLRPEHVGLFHLPIRLQDDAPQKIGEVAGNYGDLFLLMNSGDRKVIPE